MTHSGGKPHTNVGDRGQPYEVTYDDGEGNRKVFGWAETTDNVASMMESIELHPTWHSPQWRDRRTGKTGPAPTQQSRVSDVYLQASLQEISRAKALDSQMISTAFLRMLLTEIIERRAGTCLDCERLKQLLATTLDGEQGIHVSTGGKSRDEKVFSARDVQAFTAIGFAIRKQHEAKRTSPALRAYDEAMQAFGTPREPLAVYSSNSFNRVGLARTYSPVMTPIVCSDGHPDIEGKFVLHALVAAFNAMLELRREPQS
ncbi:MAG TPA: hypothetical protein VGD45_20310 [Steroidobacter sp.]|uniref:hypothetical protein n=1 Tax=Steroidobacter sp. TaxID=1978227 RepID=UPI002EDA37C2